MITENIKQQLWNLIRAYQAEGGQVRNTQMSFDFGGEPGSYNGFVRCLLGVIYKYHGLPGEFFIETPSRIFNISYKDVAQLEAGFEGWAQLEQLQLTEENSCFFIGQEIAKKLKEEELNTSSEDC